MNPFELIGWALALAAAMVIVGVTGAIVAALVRGLMNRAKNL